MLNRKIPVVEFTSAVELIKDDKGQVAGAVPAIGCAVKAGVGYAGTKAMGLAAVEYFERGGNIAGLAGVVSTATAKATQIAGDVAATPAGARVLSTVKTAVRQGAASVLKKTE